MRVAFGATEGIFEHFGAKFTTNSSWREFSDAKWSEDPSGLVLNSITV